MSRVSTKEAASAHIPIPAMINPIERDHPAIGPPPHSDMLRGGGCHPTAHLTLAGIPGILRAGPGKEMPRLLGFSPGLWVSYGPVILSNHVSIYQYIPSRPRPSLVKIQFCSPFPHPNLTLFSTMLLVNEPKSPLRGGKTPQESHARGPALRFVIPRFAPFPSECYNVVAWILPNFNLPCRGICG